MRDIFPRFSVSESHPGCGTLSNVARVLTREQLQSRKEQAVRFTREVLQDPDRAEEIAEESLEDYADRRKIEITNPTIRRNAVRAGRLPNDVFGEFEVARPLHLGHQRLTQGPLRRGSIISALTFFSHRYSPTH
jgi:hypothetical protein